MDYGLIAVLVGAIVTVASAVLSKKYLKLKGLLKTVVDALEDDSISEEEFNKIVEQAKALLKGE